MICVFYGFTLIPQMGKKSGIRRKVGKKFGTRRQVMNGTADHTNGGLTIQNLKYNSRRRIVSRSVSQESKEKWRNNVWLQLWLEATKAVTTGRLDISDLFKKEQTAIKRDVREVYKGLKKEHLQHNKLE